MIDLKGKVEITGRKNGEVIYHNEGPNLVTYWARHAVMHLLTGDSFSAVGEKRAVEGHSSTTNPDGTLLSGQQFFFHNDEQRYDDDFYWNKSTSGDNKYPFMPVKMLLGTGCEEVADAPQGVVNKYSNFVDPADTGLLSAQTKNSEDANTKTSPSITQGDFGISGAVKNGGLTLSSDLPTKTEVNDTEGRVLIPPYRGFGQPCFIYPLRGKNTHEEKNAEIMLTESDVGTDLSIEGKLTITVVLPEQTGKNSYAFYPYNGYTIKEIGLFTDAKKQIYKGSADERMPYGMLFAKRYIPPFTKTANSSFTIRWTIYI